MHVVLIIPRPQLLPRTKFLLAPLTEKVSSLEGELNSLTKQITAKQVRLRAEEMFDEGLTLA